jgi:uncharacterized membrane protein YjjB (DUF3815 family)
MWAALIPLIPGLAQMIFTIIESINADEGTPEEVKAKLEGISTDLHAVVLKVQAVELPSGE